MIIKKKKAVIAAILSAALTVSAVMPAVSAAGTRTKDEKYGDKTYATRFLSLYDDVVTNGVANGYLSDKNTAPGGFGIPYHCVEELNVEAPDYGHETTSEAMSYIVWMAAMRDYIGSKGLTDDNGNAVDATQDLAKAWETMKVMIPSEQGNFMQTPELSAQFAEEKDTPEEYPVNQDANNTGKNPIHSKFVSAYGSDKGLFLMHWLADVDDWYGYGGNTSMDSKVKGSFTFINTFQRGAQESCWETVPHPCVEKLEYGMEKRGIKGIFSTDAEVAPQWAYTNAPDAEDRAIQAVYFANRNGVATSSILSEAGKMGDELRNNMFDKYYKEIGANDRNNQNSASSAHYLMSWYTSWGGALDKTWAWQIGASHCHEFYQNPLAAYALLADKDLNGAMKASGATEDYETSLQRQLEFYLWLQSEDGPIAGGATSSWHGRYDALEYTQQSDPDYYNNPKYGTNIPTQFYGMGYLEHPVYADPGSNHWIGNQVWAIQRLAEMYYYVKTDPTPVSQKIKVGDKSVEEALALILDRWVEWFIANTKLLDDGDYKIPASLDWFGQPATWTGSYKEKTGVTCEIKAYGSSDLGCVSSLCNTLIWYAKANGVATNKAYKAYKLEDEVADPADTTPVAEKALYLAHTLLDREWELGRDDIGLSRTETNGSMVRLFEQTVHVPTSYNGTMPHGETLANGQTTFLSIRSKYNDNEKVKEFKAAYDAAGGASASAEAKTAAMETVELNYHRFWHAGDILIALGTMSDLYPDLVPDKYDNENTGNDEPDLKVDSSIEVEVGKSKDISCNVDGSTFTSNDPAVATVDNNGKVTGVKEGTTTITVTTPEGQTKDVTVTVTAKSTDPTGQTVPTGTLAGVDYLYGDVNLDNKVNASDMAKLAKYLLDSEAFALGKNDEDTGKYIEGSREQALEQANVKYDNEVNGVDTNRLQNYVLSNGKILLGPAAN